MAERSIQTVALGVVIQDDHVLVQRLAEWLGVGRPYRAIGGFVEFGESSADAVVREHMEELGRRVEVVRLLEVTEHIHDFPAISLHEIVFWYLLRFHPDDAPRDFVALPLFEQDAVEGQQRDVAEWVSLAELQAGMHEVYPADWPRRIVP